MTGSADVRVAIIGAGIGGAAAAFALRKAGIAATLYERSPRLRESGAVLGLRPRTTSIIVDEFGLGEEYRPLVSTFRTIQNRDGATGRPLFEMALGDVGVDAVASHDGIRRTDLLHLFIDRLPESAVQLGRAATAVADEGSAVRIEFADGGIEHADIVIGADGLRSTVRRLFSADDRPIYAGVVSYPGAIDAELVRDLLPDRLPSAWLRESDKAFFLLMPARGGEAIGYDAILPDANGPDDSWERTIPKQRLLDGLTGFDPAVLEILHRVPRDDFLALGLHDREPLTRFASGRVALLGDAAHPLIPAEGQGVNLAIQDAAELGRILAAGDDLPAALQEYSDARVPVAAEIHRASRERHAAGVGGGPA